MLDVLSYFHQEIIHQEAISLIEIPVESLANHKQMGNQI